MLILTMTVGAVIFTILYFGLFLYFLALYRNFIDLYYNLSNISGIRLLGVPIEELMFAASGGAVWSVAHEYLQQGLISLRGQLQSALNKPGIKMSVETRAHLSESVARIDEALKANMQRTSF